MRIGFIGGLAEAKVENATAETASAVPMMRAFVNMGRLLLVLKTAIMAVHETQIAGGELNVFRT